MGQLIDFKTRKVIVGDVPSTGEWSAVPTPCGAILNGKFTAYVQRLVPGNLTKLTMSNTAEKVVVAETIVGKQLVAEDIIDWVNWMSGVLSRKDEKK